MIVSLLCYCRTMVAQYSKHVPKAELCSACLNTIQCLFGMDVDSRLKTEINDSNECASLKNVKFKTDAATP